MGILHLGKIFFERGAWSTSKFFSGDGEEASALERRGVKKFDGDGRREDRGKRQGGQRRRPKITARTQGGALLPQKVSSLLQSTSGIAPPPSLARGGRGPVFWIILTIKSSGKR